MSFYCHAKKEVVEGETMILVPVAIRKVKYTGFFIKKGRGDEKSTKVFTGSSEGWEIVEEVPICKSMEESFTKGMQPRIVAERQVEFYKPRKKVIEKFVDNPAYYDFEEAPITENKLEQF